MILKHYDGRESLKQYCKRVIVNSTYPKEYPFGPGIIAVNSPDNITAIHRSKVGLLFAVDTDNLGWLVSVAEIIENNT